MTFSPPALVKCVTNQNVLNKVNVREIRTLIRKRSNEEKQENKENQGEKNQQNEKNRNKKKKNINEKSTKKVSASSQERGRQNECVV